MPVRWDRLPERAKKLQPTRRNRSVRVLEAWRCRTCGEVIERSYAAAERHADAHGGARLELVL